MADRYDLFALRNGVPPQHLDAWRKKAGAPPAIPAPAGPPSYEGATLQSFMPPPPTPIGPPAPPIQPRPSYEGARLTVPSSPGVALADPVRGQGRPAFPIAT